MRVCLVMEGRAVPWQRAGQGAGRKFTPREVVKAQRAWAAMARVQMGAAKPHLGAVRLSVECVYEIPKSWPQTLRDAALAGNVYRTTVPDVDNLAKLILDALNNVVWRDDSQVAELLVRKRYGLGERCSVVIQSIGDDAPPTPGMARQQRADAQGKLTPRRAPSGRAKALAPKVEG